MRSRGLGDTVAKVTHWFGIDPCGISQQDISVALPRISPAGITPDQHVPVENTPRMLIEDALESFAAGTTG